MLSSEPVALRVALPGGVLRVALPGGALRVELRGYSASRRSPPGYPGEGPRSDASWPCLSGWWTARVSRRHRRWKGTNDHEQLWTCNALAGTADVKHSTAVSSVPGLRSSGAPQRPNRGDHHVTPPEFTRGPAGRAKNPIQSPSSDSNRGNLSITPPSFQQDTRRSLPPPPPPPIGRSLLLPTRTDTRETREQHQPR